jgi:CheY-like chemotaxis protein
VKPTSVLIVHPDETVGERVSEQARTLGHRVLVVSDGEKAIDQFVQQPFDVLLVHLVLPGRDGVATVETIRWAPSGQDVPVIMSGPDETLVRLEVVAERIGAVATLGGDPSEDAIADALRAATRARTDTRTRDIARTDLAPPGQAERQAPRGPARDKGASDGSIPPHRRPGPHASRPDVGSGKLGARAMERGVPQSDIPTSDRKDDPGIPAGPSDAPFGGPGLEAGFTPDADAPRTERDPVAFQEGRDVERRASALDQAARLEGNLNDVAFPRLLARLADLRATGALVVEAAKSLSEGRKTTTGESPKKVVFFRNGVPQHVRSNLVDECLGQVLRRSGQISDEALEESLARVRDGDGRQGGILIAMGALTPHELRDTLERQQRIKLFDIFAWTSGTFRFSERMVPPKETVTLEMSLFEIIYQGVITRISSDQLRERLAPKADRFVVPDARRLAQFLRLELPDESRQLVHALDGTQRLGDLLALGRQGPSVAAHLLYALECAGAIHLKDEPQPAAELQPLSREGSVCVPWGEGPAPTHRHPRLAPWNLDPPPERTGTASLHRGEVRRTVDRVQQEGLGTTSSGHQLEPRRDEPLARGGRPYVGAGTPADAPVARATVEGGDLDDRVERMAQAERHFRRGERALRRGRASESVAAFEQAVALCPQEGEFLAWLGYARHAAAPDDEQQGQRAVEELEQGCRLAPKLDVLHVLRARVLLARGDTRGARNAFEQALTANPDCAEALDGLRQIAP